MVIAIKFKTVILSTFIILIFSLTACTNEEDLVRVTFEGESENWRVELEVERLATPGSALTYRFFHIGEGTRPETFTYEIEPKAPNTFEEEGSFDDDNEMYLQMYGDTQPVHKNMPIPITIKWDDKSEDLLVKVVK